jgi:Holliday junction DNA helicase RuvA
MIAYLKGTILKKLPKAIVLEAGSVGYLVHASTPTLEKVQEKKEIELFVHTKVREDDISLYGFESYSELEFFKTLMDVNGIGPKLSLEILSQNPEKVKSAIITGDIAYLTKIPGIGRKTAERMIVELKNKISAADIDITRLHGTIEKDVGDDAINALIGLGYQKFEISRILKDMPEKTKKIEEIITYFLRNV